MNSVEPRLVAVAGPLQGSIHPLETDEFTIGRDVSNSLPLSDSKASRRHSVLTRNGESFEISDCESTNGTFVNGLPASRRRLEHGDQIEIGSSKFLFLLRDADSDGHGGGDGARPDLNDVRLGSTVRLSPAEALYLQPERVRASLPPNREGRIALDLQVLLTASRQIAVARSVAELGEKLV